LGACSGCKLIGWTHGEDMWSALGSAD
jgi:hypothetical protein